MNVILNEQWLPVFEGMMVNIIWLTFGIFVMGMGAGLYVAVGYGAGPRDGLTLAFATILHGCFLKTGIMLQNVIGMVKKLKQRYVVGDQRVSLEQLYRLAIPTDEKKGILRSIHTVQANGVPVKIVFVRNRNKKSDWLAILSTDCTLSDQEIIRIYGIRWDIEVFFKTVKSLLKLQKEFQGRSYDSMISHTTIVFTRYIVLSWQNSNVGEVQRIGAVG